jgi:hypothetical protein
VDDTLFDEVAEATRTLVPAELGTLRLRPRRWALKAWFGPAEPIKEHYEAQIIGAKHVPGATSLGIEIGFHAEHKAPADNDECLARIEAAGPTWRQELGPEAEMGGFIGRPDQWRRVSEVWVDPNLADDELAWEIATRLTDYIVCIEPLRAGPAK